MLTFHQTGVLCAAVVTAMASFSSNNALAVGELSAHPGLSLDQSDEFEVSETLRQWTEGPSADYDLLDIDQSNDGQLTWVPTDQNNNAWYQDYLAPFRYKTVSGDFVAVTSVHAGNVSNPALAPTGAYNSAGMLVRDPASGAGTSNWVAYNLGNQAGFLGTEAKVTVNSNSNLTLVASGGYQEGLLGVCRVDDTIYTFRQFDGVTWEQTSTFNLPVSFPDEAQVGVKVNGWRNADLYATFDYIRIAEGDDILPTQCESIIDELVDYQTPIPRVFDTSESDEFSDATTLSDWTEGPSIDYDLLNINTSDAGHLTMVPSDIAYNAWYQDFTGPFRYKMITGDFVALTDVHAGQVGNPSGAPTGTYNAAGFLVRDAASSPGNADWVAFNIGNQNGSLATESKYTIDSISTLVLTDTAGAQDAQLALCRIGSTMYTYRLLPGGSGWEQTEDLAMPLSFPDTAQVGMKVNGWRNADLYATFDYFRIATGQTLSTNDCLDLANALLSEAPGDTLLLP